MKQNSILFKTRVFGNQKIPTFLVFWQFGNIVKYSLKMRVIYRATLTKNSD